MRRKGFNHLAVRIAAAGLLVGAWVARGAPAEDVRRRLDYLYDRILCACPNCSWAKTLENCVESCSEPQKAEIRRWIDEGLTDGEILERSVQLYGPRVLAVPEARGSNLLVFILPPAVLIGATIFVGTYLARRRRPEARGGAAGSADEGTASFEAIDLEIERELEAMDE